MLMRSAFHGMPSRSCPTVAWVDLLSSDSPKRKPPDGAEAPEAASVLQALGEAPDGVVHAQDGIKLDEFRARNPRPLGPPGPLWRSNSLILSVQACGAIIHWNTSPPQNKHTPEHRTRKEEEEEEEEEEQRRNEHQERPSARGRPQIKMFCESREALSQVLRTKTRQDEAQHVDFQVTAIGL